MGHNNFNPSYIGKRNDILGVISGNVNSVLDVGCSIGTLGEKIKQKINKVKVVGIEIDKQMAKVAKEKIDQVIVGDVEEIVLEDKLPPNYFDCIIFADILEHLKDPWRVLKESVKFLKGRGIVIASLLNVRHYSVILNLLFRGYWPYRERGIHDKTHLRFFTFKNIQELFEQRGLSIFKVVRNYRIIERPHHFNRFSKYFAIPFLRDFFTFQYIVGAKKRSK